MQDKKVRKKKATPIDKRIGKYIQICWQAIIERLAVISFVKQALLVVLAFFLVNVAISPLAERKLDWTAEGLSTLSPEAMSFLRNLDANFRLTLYASSKLVREVPSYASFERRAVALLEEMSRHSRKNGNRHVSFNILRPEPFSELEDEALEKGFSSVAIDQSGEQVFFGLQITRLASDSASASTPMREEQSLLLPFLLLNKEQSLEYEVMRSIVELARSSKPRVTLITSLEPLGGYGASTGIGVWRSFQALSADFDIDTVFVSEDFDATTDLVILLHPRIQDQELLYALDQYLLSGGRALLFLDPYYESAPINPQIRKSSIGVTIPLSSSNFPLLARWGIGIPSDSIVADEKHAMLIDGGSDGRVEPVPHLAWLQFGEDSLTDREPVRKIKNLILASAGAILKQDEQTQEKSKKTTEEISEENNEESKKEEDGKLLGKVSVSPLLRSSADSDLLSLDFFTSEPPQLLQAYETFTAQEARRSLAVALQGRYSSLFAERPSDMKTHPSLDAQHLSESSEDFRAIIVSDADFLNDRFWVERQNFLGEEIYTPFSGNGAFLLDAVEWLVGVEGLSGLRSRGVGERPLVYLERLRLQAEGRWRLEQKALNDKLEEIEQRLLQLRNGEQPSAESETGASRKDVSDDASERLVQSFTQQLIATRAALRKIQRALNRDVGAMQTIVQVFHALAMPLLVALFFLIRFWRRRASHPPSA